MSQENKYTVSFYYKNERVCPLDEFLDRTPGKHRSKIELWIHQLELHGPNLHRPYADVIRGSIRELRIQHGKIQYRILYFIEDHQIVLTHGFIKKTWEVPIEEIERAKRYQENWKKNKTNWTVI